MKLKKLITKLITILMTMIILMTNLMIPNPSNAAYEDTEIKIQTNDEYSGIIAHQNASLRMIYTFYINEAGEELPVYCLDKSLPGVEQTEEKSYNVTLKETVTDEKVWKILHHSYPYVTVREMGCDNTRQAYVATMAALYCVLYDWDMEEYKALTDEGEIVLESTRALLNYAYSDEITPNSTNIEIKEMTQWKLEVVNDKIYLSRTFSAKNPFMKQNYTVGLRGYVPIGTIITDTNNVQKYQFEPDEQFKVLIPREKVTKDNSIDIEINSELSTYPIYNGVPKGHHQNYAITGMEYEDGKGKKNVPYSPVGGVIYINKIDGTTRQSISGATFSLYDEYGRPIFENVETDEYGTITVPNLLPGFYYLEEVEAPEGYDRVPGQMEIPIYGEASSTINVSNNKTQVEQGEETHNVIVEYVEKNTEIVNKVENEHYHFETNNNTETNTETNNTVIEKENNNTINNTVNNNTTTNTVNNNTTNNTENNNTTTNSENNTTTNNVKNNNETTKEVQNSTTISETTNNNKIQNNINTGKKLPKTGM